MEAAGGSFSRARRVGSYRIVCTVRSLRLSWADSCSAKTVPDKVFSTVTSRNYVDLIPIEATMFNSASRPHVSHC